MNLVLISAGQLIDNTITLDDRRAAHIRKVLRSKIGDTVRVGLINGPMGTGTISALTPQEVTLRVEFHGPPPPAPLTDLILALPRPIMLKRVLAQAASLGVARIFLLNANRVEKSFFNASLIKNKEYGIFLEQGLEQAVDTRLPKISVHHRFKPFAQDLLPEIVRDCPLRLVAHPSATNSLWQAAPPPLAPRAILAVGPEGGWVDYEIEKFQQQGFGSFSLGPRILRVDTAVPALLAQLSLLRTAPCSPFPRAR